MRDNKPFARTSKLGVVAFTKPRKKLMRDEDKQRMKDSLSVRKWDGDDAS